MCRGHFHAPGTLVPLTEFYVHKGTWRTGKPFAKCKTCTLWFRKHPIPEADKWHTILPLDEVRPLVDELHRRIGPTEAARRVGMHSDALMWHRLGRQDGMRLSTVEKLLRVLEGARKLGEDGYDFLERRTANLIAGRRAHVERMRQQQREELVKSRETKNGAWGLYLESIAKRSDEAYQAIPSPDPAWWVWTGMEWLPRYGDEMLGDDF